jgi:hypothetical protein
MISSTRLLIIMSRLTMLFRIVNTCFETPGFCNIYKWKQNTSILAEYLHVVSYGSYSRHRERMVWGKGVPVFNSHHVVKICGEGEIWLYAFLISALDGSGSQFHTPADLFQGKWPALPTREEAGWAPGTGPDTVEKRKKYLPLPDIEPRPITTLSFGQNA